MPKRLISRCVCGSRGPFHETAAPNGLPIAGCPDCGVLHQITEASAADVEAQYRGEYHRAADRHPGCIPYKNRYQHDFDVSAVRWHRYASLLNGQLDRADFNMLDVGAANGAWVDYVRIAQGRVALGVDPDPAMTREAIQRGTIEDVSGSFSFVTLHDVLEHVVDPALMLQHVRDRVRVGGVVVVDVPDVFVRAGEHHFKEEHLWYFNAEALRALLSRADFKPFLFDRPVPGKLVAYAESRAL